MALTLETIRTPSEHRIRLAAFAWSTFVWLLLAAIAVPILLFPQPKPVCYWYDEEEEEYSWYIPDAGEYPSYCEDAADVPAELRTTAEAKALAEAKSSHIAAVFIFVIYGSMIALFLYLPTALAVAYIRKNGMKLGPSQWSEFFKIYEQIGKELGITNLPPAYVIDADGSANAFAVKIARRRSVVFYAELIDRLLSEGKLDELRAVAAHELTHVALGHIYWRFYLLPLNTVMFASQYLSRCQEFSADRGALFICKDPAVVASALLKLTLGVRATHIASVEQYLQDSATEKGLLVRMYTLLSTHPATADRITALRAATNA